MLLNDGWINRGDDRALLCGLECLLACGDGLLELVIVELEVLRAKYFLLGFRTHSNLHWLPKAFDISS